jgi:sec-independent protein translocase protein TatA
LTIARQRFPKTTIDTGELTMFMPGPFEMMIIAGVALLLFGKRLPDVARSVGSSISEFQKGLKAVESDIDRASIDT